MKSGFFTKFIGLFALIFGTNSCLVQDSSLTTKSKDYAFVVAGDIVVTNYSSDSAILLDKDGNYKDILYNVDNNSTDQIMGVSWDSSKKKIVLSVSGSTDRIVSISPLDGSATEVIVNAQFSGTPWGLTVDSSGNFFLIETSDIEKFDADYQRVSNGTFPATLGISNPAQIGIVPNVGFVLCSPYSDIVTTYDEDFNALNSETSSIGGTTNAYGCNSDSSGNIYVSWDGTTDTVAKYNSDFSTELLTYSDTSVLTGPRGIAIKANGNILVTDVSYHYIVELDSNLDFVRTLGGGLLNSPWHVIEVPSY